MFKIKLLLNKLYGKVGEKQVPETMNQRIARRKASFHKELITKHHGSFAYENWKRNN